MKIVIAGGSGFIGQKLTTTLHEKGHEIIILTRRMQQSLGTISYVQWLQEGDAPETKIEHADVFINLAGVSINDGRWTVKHQKEIYESRMIATDELLRIISTLRKKPSVLVNASAIGIYPASENKIYTESSTEVADDFLAKTVHDWEEKAAHVEESGIRAVFMRFGVVLGTEGGALPLMATPYKLFVGGTVGSGKQWLSWIHVDDLIRAILFVIEKENINGPVNVTAPFPKQMKNFGQTIGAILHRPHWLPVPTFAMKFLLGKKSALVLKGQQVIPTILQQENFKFLYPDLESALENLFRKNR